MIAITYRITLLEPLLATSLAGDPNSAVSFPYLPGSLMRGLLATQLLDKADAKARDLAQHERDLLFNSNVRFLNAYPVDAHGLRRLPVPLSWQVDKRKGDEVGRKIVNWAQVKDVDWDDEKRDDEGDTIPYKSLDGFVEQRSDEPSIMEPSRLIHVHHLRDRNVGRPTQQNGAIYQYDALAGGEQFRGIILAANHDLANRICELLPMGTTRLGGSRTAGYGKVRIDKEDPTETWTETPQILRDRQPGDTFVVTLLSDAILRDDRGVPCADIAAGLPAAVQTVRRYQRQIPVGGFNRKWGLPLPQERALAAGSVFVVEAQEAISKDDMAAWIEAGIGERRSEGFGRIAIDWQPEATYTQAKSQPLPPEDKISTLSPASLRLAQQMQERRQRQELDQSLRAFLGKLHRRPSGEKPITDAPANSQLSRLRVLLRNAQHRDDLQRIGSLFSATLDDMEGQAQANPHALRQKAREQFRRTRINTEGINNERMDGWIQNLVKDTQSPKPVLIWGYLDPERKIIDNHNILLTSQAIPADLSVEYTFRLIDGVLAQAMEMNRQNDGGTRNG